MYHALFSFLFPNQFTGEGLVGLLQGIVGDQPTQGSRHLFRGEAVEQMNK